MRTIFVGLVLVVMAVVLGSISSVLAAEAVPPASAGQVSCDTLAAMGLAAMQPLSDVQGLKVRGQGRFQGIVIQRNIRIGVPASAVVQINISGGVLHW
jgi:hypothetical protein